MVEDATPRAPGRARLGRGLRALVPSAAPSVIQVELDLIGGNPYQPRGAVSPASLEALAESIRAHGIIQPLLVKEEADGRYQLIAGARRLAAARLAGLATAPVMVVEATPRDSLELALVENIQRADLNPLEEAQAYRQLSDEFGLTQETLAQRVGKDRSTIANTLRLLNLSDDAKAALARGDISEGHARCLLGLHPEVQAHLIAQIRRHDWSVRQTEEAARRWRAPSAGAPSRHPSEGRTEPIASALEDDLRRALATKVNLVRGRRGGRLVIYFYSDEELQSLYERLTRR